MLDAICGSKFNLIEKSTKFSLFWNLNCDKLNLMKVILSTLAIEIMPLLLRVFSHRRHLLGAFHHWETMTSPLNHSPYGNHQGENALGRVHHWTRHKLDHLLTEHSLWPSFYLLRLFGVKKLVWSLEDQTRAEEKEKSLKTKTHTWLGKSFESSCGITDLSVWSFYRAVGPWDPSVSGEP